MLGFELGNGKTVEKQWELRGIDRIILLCIVSHD